MTLSELKNKKIHIIGVSGIEGSSIALFLIFLGCKNLFGHDFSAKDQFKKNYYYYHQNINKQQRRRQLKRIQDNLRHIYYKDEYLKNLNQADIIFSPSSWFRYKINKPLIKFSKLNNFYNWYNLLLEYFKGVFIGVTGTAGKGTTTNIIFQILKNARKKVWLLGDSWQMPPFENIFLAGKNAIIVAEVSHRTLTFAKNVNKSPAIAIITNITKHHLDDCGGSFSKYINLKKEITKYQKPDDYLIINNSDKEAKKVIKFGQAKKIPYNASGAERKLIDNKNIIGPHMLADAVAAIKAVRILKAGKQSIIKGIKAFKPREGRMQFVKIIKGVSYYNDAASTRPEATMFAVKSFAPGKVNLILEGSRKNPSKKQFIELAKVIKKQKVNNVAVSGQISEFVYPLLAREKVKTFLTKNLNESVKLLRDKSKSGDVILLSPANESFGEFKNYRERLIKFNQLVNKFDATK